MEKVSNRDCSFSALMDNINQLRMSNPAINDLINDINADLSELCNIDTRKLKNPILHTESFSNIRKQKGGFPISAHHFKRGIQACIIIMMGFMMMPNTVAMNTILTGLKAIADGQCVESANYFWGGIGLGNPVCTIWNNIMLTIRRALTGDVTVFPTLLGYISIITNTPYYTMNLINIGTYYIARQLPRNIISNHELAILNREAFNDYHTIQRENADNPHLNPAQLNTIQTMIEDDDSSGRARSAPTYTNQPFRSIGNTPHKGGKKKSRKAKKIQKIQEIQKKNEKIQKI